MIASTRMVPVDVQIDLPNLAAQWMMGNLATLLADLGDRWPGCADEMTPEVAAGLYMSQSLYNLRTAAVAESLRVQANEVMAAAFEQADFIIAATNPGPAFPAEASMSSSEANFIDWAKSSSAASYAFRSILFGTRLTSAFVPKLPSVLMDRAAPYAQELLNMGGLTIISNIYGNPAVSIPAGTVDGLPVGMQVLTRHHDDELLFDVALAVERERPWPLVAPSSTVLTTAKASAPAR
jgi:aspartyl-tRNA(Asn)/glutamyl-tRNA(Gln) amidotransferase subunit A